MAEHSEKRPLTEHHYERSCFIVFSSREPHIPGVLQRLCDLLENELRINPIRLDEARQPGEIVQTQLLDAMRACNFGIVLLDGFRPNVIFELGLLIAFGIPRLIMLERSSTINVDSLFNDVGVRPKPKLPALKIDVQKHLSDLANIGISYYSASDDLEFRGVVRRDIKKLIAKSSKSAGADLEFGLIEKIEASKTVSENRFRRLLGHVSRARAKLNASQSGHVTFHLSRALCRRKSLSVALRLVAEEMKKTRAATLTAQHAFILHAMGQTADAFNEIATAIARYPNEMPIVRAYCILAIESGAPRKALQVLEPLSYEKLVLSDLIEPKALALFILEDALRELISYSICTNRIATSRL